MAVGSSRLKARCSRCRCVWCGQSQGMVSSVCAVIATVLVAKGPSLLRRLKAARLGGLFLHSRSEVVAGVLLARPHTRPIIHGWIAWTPYDFYRR
jgi:hypothetical protein